jgi:hypothetical protein
MAFGFWRAAGRRIQFHGQSARTFQIVQKAGLIQSIGIPIENGMAVVALVDSVSSGVARELSGCCLVA